MFLLLFIFQGFPASLWKRIQAVVFGNKEGGDPGMVLYQDHLLPCYALFLMACSGLSHLLMSKLKEIERDIT